MDISINYNYKETRIHYSAKLSINMKVKKKKAIPKFTAFSPIRNLDILKSRMGLEILISEYDLQRN